MRRAATPLDLWMLGLTSAAIAAEANTVVAMRVMGMMGGWSLPSGESARMVAEKGDALREASVAVAGAMVRGATPATVAMAALKPVRRRTAANVRRLAKRGIG